MVSASLKKLEGVDRLRESLLRTQATPQGLGLSDNQLELKGSRVFAGDVKMLSLIVVWWCQLTGCCVMVLANLGVDDRMNLDNVVCSDKPMKTGPDVTIIPARMIYLTTTLSITNDFLEMVLDRDSAECTVFVRKTQCCIARRICGVLICQIGRLCELAQVEQVVGHFQW